MPKVLIVDDDIELATVVDAMFVASEWHTEKAHNGADALQLLKGFKFDLIILDWNLPDTTGIQICQEFRADGGQTPIMFLTGRNTYPEKELGFNSGGDEYMTKPFDNRELLARARAMLRRPTMQTAENLSIRGVQLDPRGKKVLAGDQTLQLSTTEFSIIEHLFKNAGTFYTANQLFEELWPVDTDTDSGIVRVYVKLLRRKLELFGHADLIKTVRGAGYVVERDS